MHAELQTPTTTNGKPHRARLTGKSGGSEGANDGSHGSGARPGRVPQPVVKMVAGMRSEGALEENQPLENHPPASAFDHYLGPSRLSPDRFLLPLQTVRF